MFVARHDVRLYTKISFFQYELCCGAACTNACKSLILLVFGIARRLGILLKAASHRAFGMSSPSFSTKLFTIFVDIQKTPLFPAT